jgi:energy-coupling factor transport system permease protein
MSPKRTTHRASRITYHPGDSFLHRLHPLTKAAWLLFGTAFVFAVRSPWAVAGTVVLLVLGFPVAGVRLGRVRGTRLFVSTALLLGLLQVLFVRQGAALVEIGPLVVTAGGVERGVYVAGRFLSIILLSYLFVLTTEPNDLAYALMRAGLPYRYGFALITALRLVPTFEQEGQIVYNAQLARGVRYDVRSPRRFLTLARQFTLPLLVSALGKVDGLAVSMEGRCFGKYPTRTFLREVRATWLDGVAVGVLMVGLVAVGYWVFEMGGL